MCVCRDVACVFLFFDAAELLVDSCRACHANVLLVLIPCSSGRTKGDCKQGKQFYDSMEKLCL